MKVTLITACIRPNNLPLVAKSIIDSAVGSTKIHWLIVFDNRRQLIDIDKAARVAKDYELPHSVIDFRGSPTESPINPALEQIEDGFVSILDDDNLVHPEYFKEISSVLTTEKQVGLLYNQYLGKDNKDNTVIRYVTASNIRPGKVDAAQITVSRSLIGNTRWPEVDPNSSFFKKLTGGLGGTPSHMPDGVFIKTLYEKHMPDFIILPKVLCYYNALSGGIYGRF